MLLFNKEGFYLSEFIGIFFFCGYIRVFFGIHFLDHDKSANEAKERFIKEKRGNKDLNKIFSDEGIRRPMLYFSTLFMLWSICLGDYPIARVTFFCSGFIQIFVMLRYLYIYYEILLEYDDDKKWNKCIYVADGIYIFSTLYLCCFVLFTGFREKLLSWNFTTWGLLIFMSFFFVVFVLEMIVVYIKSLCRAVMAYFSIIDMIHPDIEESD
ncbi:MAG: hypothetical protein K8R67_03815 [Desulfobacteraceae bacterium]|nr:hypothetical protein [Desulfobacteraceae bacterium]